MSESSDNVRKQHVFWTREKGELVEKMYESGETTKRIAELTGTSIRSVQNYINQHISEYEGDKWKPFEPIVRHRSQKRQMVEIEVQKILDSDCTLTQIIDRLPDSLKDHLKGNQRSWLH